MNLTLNMVVDYPELKDLYYNKYIKTDEHKLSKDSGIDLFCYFPDEGELTINPGETVLVDLHVKCSMVLNGIETGYDLRARSSIWKTPLRIANSVGLIDSGYRGNIKVAFDNIKNTPYTIKNGQRLVQLASPQLFPLELKLVDSLSETVRGELGFGSSGL